MNPLPGDLFARRLRQERQRQQISQAELARRTAEILQTSLDPSAITRIEQRTRTVRLDEAVAVAQALDVPLVTLLEVGAEVENEAALQESIAELALLQGRWERYRQEIERVMQNIHTLTSERARIRGLGHLGTGGEPPTGQTDPD